MKNQKTSMKDDNKMYFYESIADHFDSIMNMYDTNKRLNVVFHELLNESIENKNILDAGCGTGWFSKWACDRKAKVTSMDLGENLLKKTAQKCSSKIIIGSVLKMPFEDNTFDIIISSEVIEHVTEPYLALKEMYRVLKPEGTLIITTPNKFWHFSVSLANLFKLRPYQGLENWLGWREIKREIKKTGFTIKEMKGIHLFPFIFPILNPVLDFFHKYNNLLGPFMVNIAIKAVKTSK